MQHRKHSLIESIVNTASGFVVNYAAGFVIFPLFGYEPRALELGGITLVYTGLSLARNYLVRRAFVRG